MRRVRTLFLSLLLCLPALASYVQFGSGINVGTGSYIKMGGGSPPPPFNPVDLTGRIVHYYATAGNVSLTGSEVNQWNDLSTNGFNATPGNPLAKPTYSTAVINGKDAVTFGVLGATAQTLGFSNSQIFSAGRGTSLYWVFKHNTFTAGSAGNIFFTGKIGASVNFPCFGYDHASLAYFWSGEPGDIGQFAKWAVAEDTTSWHSAAFVYNGGGYGTAGNTTMYFDKVLQTTATFATSQYGSSNTIASYANPGIKGFSFDGSIAILLVVDHAFSGTELSNLNTWAAGEYGI